MMFEHRDTSADDGPASARRQRQVFDTLFKKMTRYTAASLFDARVTD